MNRNRVLCLWGEQVPVTEIANQLGVTTARVYQILKEEGKSPSRRGCPTRADLPPFAVLLRQYREAAGLTQANLAGRCKMPLVTLRNLEQGTTEPLLYTAKTLAGSLGVFLDNLARREHESA